MINRISAVLLTTAALAVVVGLPLFACLRDSKALQSTAQLCHFTESLEECLEPLPPV
jgi:hypothetical protein